MTLVVTVNGPDTIWALADRRLSYPKGVYKDNARKIMFLETTDGCAILSYAGLGATGLGTEPSDWMSRVLRGVNAPLEQSLGILADAMKRQFPQHMVRMFGSASPTHSIVATAFVNDEPRLYTIDLAFTADRRKYHFGYTRHARPRPGSATRLETPRIFVTGTGGLYLAQTARKGWMRPLIKVVQAHDRGLLSAQAVSDHLAALNEEVREAVPTVGPKCIVAWRYREPDSRKEGSGQFFYSATKHDPASRAALPTILSGMDFGPIVNVLVPHVLKHFDAVKKGQPPEELDIAAMNEELSRLPGRDEHLQ